MIDVVPLGAFEGAEHRSAIWADLKLGFKLRTWLKYTPKKKQIGKSKLLKNLFGLRPTAKIIQFGQLNSDLGAN